MGPIIGGQSSYSNPHNRGPLQGKYLGRRDDHPQARDLSKLRAEVIEAQRPQGGFTGVRTKVGHLPNRTKGPQKKKQVFDDIAFGVSAQDIEDTEGPDG